MNRALWLSAALIGCTGKLSISEFDVVPSGDIVTVATVSWTSDGGEALSVEYGATEDFGQSTPTSTSGTMYLLGLKPETEHFARLVLTDGDDVQYSETVSFTTGLLPNSLATLTATGSTDDDFYMSVPLLTAGELAIPSIIDNNGDFAWYYLDESGLDVYRTRLSLDGQSVLYNAGSVSGDPAADSKIYRVALDGSSIEEIEVPLLAHDFVELPDGTIGAMATEYRDGELDGEPFTFRGDQIIEIAPDGSQSVAWSAWDCFDPSEVIGDSIEQGWTFGNALDYDPDDDVYYFGMRNFSSIARIDRQTGSCDWVFGSTGATIEPDGSSDVFLHQHQFQVLDDSLLVFDNDGSTERTSRVLEYSFDGSTTPVEQIWSYVPENDLYTFVLGDVNRFDDGDTLVTWSVLGQIDRVTAAGESEWTLNTDLGFVFGFNTVTTSLYVADQ
ncbi:MAG: hypothetical protein ACI8S6_004423 [Myxococcota bacterium]|jgi:hypothetical protein